MQYFLWADKVRDETLCPTEGQNKNVISRAIAKLFINYTELIPYPEQNSLNTEVVLDIVLSRTHMLLYFDTCSCFCDCR